MGRQSGLTGDEAYAILHNKNDGGSGGTSNYNQLSNKPLLNGVEISGSKTSVDYGIYFSVADDGTLKIGGD